MEQPKAQGRIARKVAPVIFALVLLLAALEAGLRMRFGFGHPLLYMADSFTGYIPRPNQEISRFGASIFINAYSMRSKRIGPSKETGKHRVLFIGDSVTFGTTYVDQREIFTDRLANVHQRRLKEPIDVLNASAGGWAPANEYAYLQSRGTFGADLVVFVLNTNDLDQPFAALETSAQFPTSNPKTAIGEVWSRYIWPRLVATASPTDPGSNAEELPNLPESRKILQTLENAKSFSENHGAKFALVFSPSDYDRMKTAVWKNLLERLKAWALAEGVEVLDMTPVYARYPRSQIYLDNIHLKPFAHALVAEAIDASITQSL